MNHITLNKRLALSRQEALWWSKKPLPTWSQFFSFPNPINEAESRIHNICVCVLVAASILLDYFKLWQFPWIEIYIIYGYIARVAAGPRLDPQVFFEICILFYFPFISPFCFKSRFLKYFLVGWPMKTKKKVTLNLSISFL